MRTDSIEKSLTLFENSKMSNTGKFYLVTELETMYFDLLKSDNIYHNNHFTTFLTFSSKMYPV